ncbi:MarC family protein [Escherichia coli]
MCHHDGGVLRRATGDESFGISIPGLRIAGGLIVAFIGFRMLFPQQKAIDCAPEAKSKSEELEDEPSANIAFVPLAIPSTAGPGTVSDDY